MNSSDFLHTLLSLRACYPPSTDLWMQECLGISSLLFPLKNGCYSSSLHILTQAGQKGKKGLYPFRSLWKLFQNPSQLLLLYDCLDEVMGPPLTQSGEDEDDWLWSVIISPWRERQAHLSRAPASWHMHKLGPWDQGKREHVSLGWKIQEFLPQRCTPSTQKKMCLGTHAHEIHTDWMMEYLYLYRLKWQRTQTAPMMTL